MSTFVIPFRALVRQEKLMVQDAHFFEPMNDVESRAWKSFISVIQTLLGNRKVNYKQLLGELTQRELELCRAWYQNKYKNTFSS